ncbi:hypothetical protein KM043_000724 [Ampulex compressa]|nr:hypothetical protein KM043_000724 [Ampulex compressa]
MYRSQCQRPYEDSPFKASNYSPAWPITARSLSLVLPAIPCEADRVLLVLSSGHEKQLGEKNGEIRESTGRPASRPPWYQAEDRRKWVPLIAYLITGRTLRGYDPTYGTVNFIVNLSKSGPRPRRRPI